MEYPFYGSRLYRVSCRKKAQRLLDYPWKTHVLWEIDNLHLEIEPDNEVDERFLHYLACFSEFESRIFFNHAALRCSPEVAMLRESISYAPYRFDSVPLPWPNTKDHKRYAELCSVLTSYRLAEVFIQHLSPNLVREQPSSELSRRAIEGHHSILNKAWLHMADIETLVNGFVYALPHGKSSLLSSGSESSSSEDLLPCLLQRLARHKGNNKSNRIALNFAVTAIHLLYITSQKFSGARPDIPNSFRELLDTIPRSSSTPVEFTNADIDYLQDLMADMNNFKTPLQLAANLTPLALFIPVDLTKTPCSRVFIIEAAKALGSRTLPEVEVLETSVWNSLFEITAGKPLKSVLSALARHTSEFVKTAKSNPLFKSWFALKDSASQTPASTQPERPSSAIEPVVLQPVEENPDVIDRSCTLADGSVSGVAITLSSTCDALSACYSDQVAQSAYPRSLSAGGLAMHNERDEVRARSSSVVVAHERQSGLGILLPQLATGMTKDYLHSNASTENRQDDPISLTKPARIDRASGLVCIFKRHKPRSTIGKTWKNKGARKLNVPLQRDMGNSVSPSSSSLSTKLAEPHKTQSYSSQLSRQYALPQLTEDCKSCPFQVVEKSDFDRLLPSDIEGILKHSNIIIPSLTSKQVVKLDAQPLP